MSQYKYNVHLLIVIKNQVNTTLRHTNILGPV